MKYRKVVEDKSWVFTWSKAVVVLNGLAFAMQKMKVSVNEEWHFLSNC